MNRIRWEEDFGEYTDEHVWLGYLGKIVVCQINCDYDLDFHPTRDGEIYSKLSSAKRGAERMLDKFLNDANLTIKENHDEK